MTACAVEFIEKARGGKKIVKVCPTGRAGFGGSCGGMRLPSGYLGKMPAGRGELARGGGNGAGETVGGRETEAGHETVAGRETVTGTVRPWRSVKL